MINWISFSVNICTYICCCCKSSFEEPFLRRSTEEVFCCCDFLLLLISISFILYYKHNLEQNFFLGLQPFLKGKIIKIKQSLGNSRKLNFFKSTYAPKLDYFLVKTYQFNTFFQPLYYQKS